MKKKVTVILVMFACLFLGQIEVSAIDGLVIAPTEIVIGGIGKNCTYDYIKKIYGEPTKEWHRIDRDGISTIKLVYGSSYDYSWNITTKLINGEYYVTFMVLGSRAPGICTPAGIHTGSTFSEVRNAYGVPHDEWYLPSGIPNYEWYICDRLPMTSDPYKAKHSDLIIQVCGDKVDWIKASYRYDGADMLCW